MPHAQTLLLVLLNSRGMEGSLSPHLLQGAEPVHDVPSKGGQGERDRLLQRKGGTVVTLGGCTPARGGAQSPSPGLREARIASAFNYSLSAYQMLLHLLYMNAD